MRVVGNLKRAQLLHNKLESEFVIKVTETIFVHNALSKPETPEVLHSGKG